MPQARYRLVDTRKGNLWVSSIPRFRLALQTNPGSRVSRQALTDLGQDFSDLIPEVSVDRAMLARYVGSYDLQQATPSEITLEGDKLFREFYGTRFQLHPRSDTEFYTMEVDANQRGQESKGSEYFDLAN